MIIWYRRIQENGIDEELDDAILYYDNELEQAREDIKIRGSAEAQMAKLPGIIEYRYAQLQDLCAICEYVEVEKNKIISVKFKGYLEGYSKKIISSRDADKFVYADQDVDDISKKLISISLCKDQFLGISKGLESKHYQLTNIVKLKTAGINDFEINF